MPGDSWNTLLSAKEESLIQNRADKIAAEENYQEGLDCYSRLDDGASNSISWFILLYRIHKVQDRQN